MTVLYTYCRTFATNYLITIGLMEPKLQRLPLRRDLESIKVLKALPRAHAALAELKGLASSIPNHQILINTLALQEAKDSSAIENIITTHNELFSLDASNPLSSSAKEVQNYRIALELGFNSLKDRPTNARRHVLRGRFVCVGGHARLGRRRVRPARGLLVPPPQPRA